MNNNPNLVDQRLLNKIASKRSIQTPNISINKGNYNSDLFIVLVEFLKKNIGIMCILIFLIIILYQRYEDVKKRKLENSALNISQNFI